MQTSNLAFYAALGATTTVTFSASMANAEATSAWDLIKAIEIEEIISEDNYEVRKTFPAGLEEQGTGIEITGYAFPMLPGETIRELILVSDMGLCPLCGEGDHGANLQVTLAEPITTFDESMRITLKGNLEAITDPETWQAAILKDAQIIAQ